MVDGALSRRGLWVQMLLYPGHTFPTAAAPALVGIGLAVREQVFLPTAAVLAFIAGWLIQVGGVLTDNHENLARHPDDREHPELVRALRSGTLTLRHLQLAIAGCYCMALAIGGWLAWLAGFPVVAVGLASIAASWAYSAGPWRIGEHGLADPLFFSFFGWVSVAGVYYVQAAPALANPFFWQYVPEALPKELILLAIPVGALTTAILVIDDLRDREFDMIKGKRTIAVRFGVSWSRAEFIALLGCAYAMPLLLSIVVHRGPALLLPMASFPLAWGIGRTVLVSRRVVDLAPMTARAATLVLLYSALLGVGLAFT